MAIRILKVDETETGPRVRKTLTDIHGVTCTLERAEIDGLRTREGTTPVVNLYSWTRPSNGERLWLIEAELYFPPDVQLWRSYVLDSEPSETQIREIVAADAQEGSVL